MHTLTERRKFGRIGLEARKYKEIDTPCIAKFCVNQFKGHGNTSHEWEIVAIQNLSAGGMLFTYDKDLGINTTINLTLEISKSRSTICYVGKVVRILELKHLTGFCTAVMFTEIISKRSGVMEVTINKILRKRSGKREFLLNTFVKKVNFMKRGSAVEIPLPENLPTLQKEEVKACGSCNQTISARDSVIEQCGQLLCQKCSN